MDELAILCLLKFSLQIGLEEYSIGCNGCGEYMMALELPSILVAFQVVRLQKYHASSFKIQCVQTCFPMYLPPSISSHFNTHLGIEQ